MTDPPLRIGIFGIGYVGAVSAACLARAGHDVVCVDTSPDKVDLIRRGEAPIIESGLAELTKSEVEAGRLRATTEVAEAVTDRDVVLVCVGTPSRPNGDLDLTYVGRVCEQIGAALADHPNFCAVVLRSTVLPGTLEGLVVPTLERSSGRRAGEGFGAAFYPEFLREGSAIADFADPGTAIYAATDDETAARVERVGAASGHPHERVDPATAEMVKYASNSWHALKVAYANEIGSIARAVGVDGQRIMDILCRDTKLNISPRYLRPGYAFGGSCLPKDVRALEYKGRSLDLELPVLESILPANRAHLERGLELIKAVGKRRVGVLGISFKAGTDDVRESPMIDVVEHLLGKGYELLIYDKSVNLSQLVGANRAFMLERLPHVSKLLVDDPERVLEHAETVVVGNPDGAAEPCLAGLRPEQVLVDLVRLAEPPAAGDYRGICW